MDGHSENTVYPALPPQGTTVTLKKDTKITISYVTDSRKAPSKAIEALEKSNVESITKLIQIFKWYLNIEGDYTENAISKHIYIGKLLNDTSLIYQEIARSSTTITTPDPIDSDNIYLTPLAPSISTIFGAEQYKAPYSIRIVYGDYKTSTISTPTVIGGNYKQKTQHKNRKAHRKSRRRYH